jgi:hypothetical protein
MMKQVIATMVDSCHFPWLIKSLESLRLTNPAIPIYVVLIGGDARKVIRLRKANPRVSYEIYTGLYHRCVHNSLSQFKPRAIRGAMKKFKMKNGDKIVWVDADCIYTGSIGEIFNILDDHDLTIKVQKKMANGLPRKHYIKRIFNAGVIGIKISSVMIRFFDSWSKRIYFGVRSETWCDKQHDQGRLYLTYEVYKSKIKFHPLPHIYNTPFINKKEPIPKIWHMMAMKKHQSAANETIRKLFVYIKKGERKSI